MGKHAKCNTATDTSPRYCTQPSVRGSTKRNTGITTNTCTTLD